MSNQGVKKVGETHTTVTFTDKQGLFEFTVKKEFVDAHGDASQFTIEELVTQKSFNTFLHNPNGPAVKYLTKFPQEVMNKLAEHPSLRKHKDQIVGFWLDGQLLQNDQLEKFLHDINFKDDFRNFVAGN